MRALGLIVVSVLAWMCGLAALDVPAGLPAWRHFLGAALIVLAMRIWRLSTLHSEAEPG
jgi:hypothetical protein